MSHCANIPANHNALIAGLKCDASKAAAALGYILVYSQSDTAICQYNARWNHMFDGNMGKCKCFDLEIAFLLFTKNKNLI